ncbi:hypothetical protein [Streptomyces sp. P9-A2]|uniref:hypothetical protein n=1 Tax=Streptomyces sp. P9-A2 TaxID=3072284 RepID=UPI002FCB58F6
MSNTPLSHMGTESTRARAVRRSLALTALLATTALACSPASDKDEAGHSTSPSPATTSSTALGETSADARIEQVNETMRKTPFSAIGTTTAFDEGQQEIRWNPSQGLHIKLVGTGGDMYCKDGVTYMSADLLAKNLQSKGVQITVPDRLDDTYVTTESGQGCDAYFAVPPGTFAPDKDTEIEGVPAQAVAAASGSTSDVYYISEEDPARLLKMESTRDGRKSRTTYTDFGKETSIVLPKAGQVMPLEEFREEVNAG